MALFFFRFMSKWMLLGYLALMGWLAWDILLLTPAPNGHFDRLLMAGTAIVMVPVFLALFSRRTGTVTFFNVLTGTALWMVAGVFWALLHVHSHETAVCHAVQDGQTQMIPHIEAWVRQILHR